MKILVTATIGQTIAAFLVDQVVELKRRGYEVVVLCAEPEAVVNLRIDDVRVLTAAWTRPARLTALPSAIRQTRRTLRSESPSILFVHTSVAAAITRLATLGLRHAPLVAYCAHGFDGARSRPWYRRLPSRLVERVLAGDKPTCCSS